MRYTCNVIHKMLRISYPIIWINKNFYQLKVSFINKYILNELDNYFNYFTYPTFHYYLHYFLYKEINVEKLPSIMT